jgi:hypothetical protein
MSTERSPLLHHDVEQHRNIPRPDIRNSPENVIVDGNESQGKSKPFLPANY